MRVKLKFGYPFDDYGRWSPKHTSLIKSFKTDSDLFRYIEEYNSRVSHYSKRITDFIVL